MNPSESLFLQDAVSKGVQVIVCGYNGFPDFLCSKDGLYWWVEVKNGEKYHNGHQLTYASNHYLRETQNKVRQALGLKGDIILIPYGTCEAPQGNPRLSAIDLNDLNARRASDLLVRLDIPIRNEDIINAVLQDIGRYCKPGTKILHHLFIQSAFGIGINRAYTIKTIVSARMKQSGSNAAL